MMPYKLLAKFEATFRDGPYRHRNANLGNRIADFLYEDMVDVDPTSKFATRASSGARVLNPAIVVPGIRARRGDGSFGAPIPQTQARYEPGFNVARGATATVEVGAEVKIVAKAMGKQIDRVINDLRHQVVEFRQKSDRCLTVGIVGVNFSDYYISYEGARTFPTGPGHRAPSSEAPIAERRLATEVAGDYDEFLLLGFKTTNEPPYPFEWLALANKEQEYGALLVRLLEAYDRRF